MPRKAKALTKRDLDALVRQAEANLEFGKTLADHEQKGLYVQARRGRVSFLFRYRPPGGGARRVVAIDEYGRGITLDAARRIARGLREQVADRIDPRKVRAEEQRLAVTVAGAVESYLVDLRERTESGARRGKRSSYGSAKNRLEGHVVPVLGAKRLREVTGEDVRKLHRSMKATPVEANRTLTCLSAVFAWASRAELVPAGFNPVHRVERYREDGRRRALTREELTALGAVMREAEQMGSVPLLEHGKPIKRKGKPLRTKIGLSPLLAMRLLALTSFRRGEVLGAEMRERRGDREGLRWADLDLDRGLVRLRDSKTGPQERVIGAAAVELLQAARPPWARDSDPVCPGTRPGAPFVGLDKARARLYAAAGIGATAEGRADLHSLRHTFASIGAHVQNGRFAAFVGPLLGHGHQMPRAITARYVHSEYEALKVAADAIAGEIAQLLGLEEPGKVIAFPGSER